MNKELKKRCDFDAMVSEWFDRSVWHIPVGIVARQHGYSIIIPCDFYYNYDKFVNISNILSADFSNALISDGVIVNVAAERIPHVGSNLMTGNSFAYRANMQMIMDKTIEPELYASLLI